MCTFRCSDCSIILLFFFFKQKTAYERRYSDWSSDVCSSDLQAGAVIKGKRNENFYVEGQPYLDGFEAIIAEKQSLRVQAIRGDRAAAEFRGMPPKSRDDLKAALGDKITVQESDWNCVLIITPNHNVPPFDNVKARRALTLAVDRWGGSPYPSQTAIEIGRARCRERVRKWM